MYPDTGYLGGDVSADERRRLRDKHLRDRPIADYGFHNQCRCGGTEYTLWRARYYCVRCGRWKRHLRPA